MPNSWKRVLVGRPLASAAEKHERLGKIAGLAVFASDALSSVAYGTEEILLVLVAAGTAALTLSLPIMAGITMLVGIVAASYWQTIHAYPSGGGAYIVAKDNLGELPGLIAGASLLIDYVLTVAVSTAAGVAAVTSAFPGLFPWRVVLCVFCVVAVTLANLRGVRESGRIFTVPTYWFILSLIALIVAGLFRVATGTVQPLPAEHVQATETLTLFLILRAFSSGCATLTGIEAVSNGVPAFRPPEAKNAALTLVWMATILATTSLGVAYLAHAYQVTPKETETVVSMLGRSIFGGEGLLYYNIQVSTALILFLAVNTSYQDFPRLSSILARDAYMPRQMASRGDRLVFSNGILILAGLSIILLVAFEGSTNALIPLYAVGVFLSFTLSQSGMVRHWLKEEHPALRHILMNGLGALATGIVCVVIAVTKFTHGAWMVIVLIPLIVLLFLRIHRHYQHVAAGLSLEGARRPRIGKNPVVVLVGGLHKGTIEALEYAKSISPNVTALTVDLDPTQTSKMRRRWAEWEPDVPLVVLDSPYRSVLRPVLEYIDRMERQGEGRYLTIVIPEFVPKHWWAHILHNQTAFLIKAALLFRPGKVSISVPYHLED